MIIAPQSTTKLDTLRTCGWRDYKSPPMLAELVSMLVPDERAMLYHLGREYFSGEGIIVDAGCFLGGSTVSLGLGVKDNPTPRAHDPAIYTYDLFRVEPWAVGKNWPVGKRFRHVLDLYRQRKGGESFRDLFDSQTEAVRDEIRVIEGDICRQPVPERPVEILFLDILKSAEICDFVIERYFPLLIPGKSVVVQQDYLFGRRTHWIHITMEMLHEYFEPIAHCQRNSVLFFYRSPLPPELDLRAMYSRLSKDEQEYWMDRAISRWDGDNRAFLESARRHMRVETNLMKVATTNLNPWCRVPDDPFSQPIVLHPALDGQRNPEVLVKNLVFNGGEGFRTRVALPNEKATNDVVVEFVATRGQEVVHTLQVYASANRTAHFELPAGAGALDVRIRVRKRYETQPAHYCRVMIGPLLLVEPNRSPAKPASAPLAQTPRGDIGDMIVVPIQRDDDRGTFSIKRKAFGTPREAADLPIPPKDLRAYGEEADRYVDSGGQVMETMIGALAEYRHPLEANKRVLEFGCSNGRLLRWLLPYSRSMEIWGVDVDADMIKWATENLGDHFNFAVCTQVPHLPFPDGYFDLVFAGSVFTRLHELHVSWMLELARVLRSDSVLYATFLDEAAVDTLQREAASPLSKELRAHPAGRRVFGGDYDYLSISLDRQAYLPDVYMKRAYIERIGRPEFEVLGTVPNAFAGFESAYIFRKR